MFGYALPYFSRMSASDLGNYRRFYCEACHHLKKGYGLISTETANYDMTFNLIVLEALRGDAIRFERTPSGPTCVFRNPRVDSNLFRDMAGYTLLLTKWELYDDKIDKPSIKTNFIDLALSRAISKAEERYPEYDRAVGEGFAKLRDYEEKECTDAPLMGRKFGKALTIPLSSIAKENDSPPLRELFISLTAAIYVMDAIDDLEQDFKDNTYNPFLTSCKRFINRRDYMSTDVYAVAETINGCMASLQNAYVDVRRSMKALTGITDNVVYLGLPESAKKAIDGTGKANLTIGNALQLRKERTAAY